MCCGIFLRAVSLLLIKTFIIQQIAFATPGIVFKPLPIAQDLPKNTEKLYFARTLPILEMETVGARFAWEIKGQRPQPAAGARLARQSSGGGLTEARSLKPAQTLEQKLTSVVPLLAALVSFFAVSNFIFKTKMGIGIEDAYQMTGWSHAFVSGFTAIGIGMSARLMGMYLSDTQIRRSTPIMLSILTFQTLWRFLLGFYIANVNFCIDHFFPLPSAYPFNQALRGLIAMVAGVTASGIYDMLEPTVLTRIYIRQQELTDAKKVTSLLEQVRLYRQWPRVQRGLMARLASSYFQNALAQNVISADYRELVLFGIGFFNTAYRTMINYTQQPVQSTYKVLTIGLLAAAGSFIFISPDVGVTTVILASASGYYFHKKNGKPHPSAARLAHHKISGGQAPIGLIEVLPKNLIPIISENDGSFQKRFWINATKKVFNRMSDMFGYGRVNFDVNDSYGRRGQKVQEVMVSGQNDRLLRLGKRENSNITQAQWYPYYLMAIFGQKLGCVSGNIFIQDKLQKGLESLFGKSNELSGFQLFGRKMKSGLDVIFGQLRKIIIRGDFFWRNSSFQKLQDLPDHDAGTKEAGLSVANSRVYAHQIIQMVFHMIPPDLLDQVWHAPNGVSSSRPSLVPAGARLAVLDNEEKLADRIIAGIEPGEAEKALRAGLIEYLSRVLSGDVKDSDIPRARRILTKLGKQTKNVEMQREAQEVLSLELERLREDFEAKKAELQILLVLIFHSIKQSLITVESVQAAFTKDEHAIKQLVAEIRLARLALAQAEDDQARVKSLTLSDSPDGGICMIANEVMEAAGNEAGFNQKCIAFQGEGQGPNEAQHVYYAIRDPGKKSGVAVDIAHGQLDTAYEGKILVEEELAYQQRVLKLLDADLGNGSRLARRSFGGGLAGSLSSSKFLIEDPGAQFLDSRFYENDDKKLGARLTNSSSFRGQGPRNLIKKDGISQSLTLLRDDKPVGARLVLRSFSEEELAGDRQALSSSFRGQGPRNLIKKDLSSAALGDLARDDKKTGVRLASQILKESEIKEGLVEIARANQLELEKGPRQLSILDEGLRAIVVELELEARDRLIVRDQNGEEIFTADIRKRKENQPKKENTLRDLINEMTSQEFSFDQAVEGASLEDATQAAHTIYDIDSYRDVGGNLDQEKLSLLILSLFRLKQKDPNVSFSLWSDDHNRVFMAEAKEVVQSVKRQLEQRFEDKHFLNQATRKKLSTLDTLFVESIPKDASVVYLGRELASVKTLASNIRFIPVAGGEGVYNDYFNTRLAILLARLKLGTNSALPQWFMQAYGSQSHVALDPEVLRAIVLGLKIDPGTLLQYALRSIPYTQALTQAFYYRVTTLIAA